MKARCTHCTATIALRDGGAKPGDVIRFACPKCGAKYKTTMPKPSGPSRTADQLLSELFGGPIPPDFPWGQK